MSPDAKTIPTKAVIDGRLLRAATWGVTLCTHYFLVAVYTGCLQCFNAVGWAAGRASGL